MKIKKNWWKIGIGAIIIILLIIWLAEQQDFVCGNPFLDFMCKK